MKPVLMIIITGLLALGVGTAARQFQQAPADSTTVNTLPNFNLPDISGRQHSISEWQGKLLIINFWATWCPPCLKEIPEFIKLQNQHAAQGLQFIGIAIDDNFAVADFIKTTPINYPNLIGQEEGISLAEQLGNVAGVLPFTVIVNQQGQIIYRQPGELSTEKVLTLITPLLKKH
ncbi:MAG: TlpA disulfide reductase family protein [Methylococcales bacterium]